MLISGETHHRNERHLTKISRTRHHYLVEDNNLKIKPHGKKANLS